MDCSSPGSSVHGILQARKREWVVISFSRGFPGSNPHLLHWQADSLPLSHKGSPQEWIPSIHCKVPGKISLWLCQGEKKSIHRERVQLCATPKHNYEILFQQDEGNSCLLQLFPGSSAGKESTCNAGDPGSIPGSARSSGEGIGYPLQYSWASFVAQLVKNPPAMWETWVWSLGWEYPLEKGKATHSSILAWRIPWTV